MAAPAQPLRYSGNGKAGCPTRIRTLIDGVRVRSLTIRGSGNSGPRSRQGRANGQGPAPNDWLSHAPDCANPAPSSGGLWAGPQEHKERRHGRSSRHYAAPACRRAPGPGGCPSGAPAQKALARRAALCRARPRHQQLPPADRAAAGQRLRGGRRLFADRPAGRRAGVERAAVRCGDRPHHRRAARLFGQAPPPQRPRRRARSRPRHAARPPTAPSSSTAPIARPGSGSTSFPPRKRRGSRCSAATR